MALNLPWALDALKELRPDPLTGELYLTTLVEQASAKGKEVAAISITNPAEALGCDDLESLAAAEKQYFRRAGRRVHEKRAFASAIRIRLQFPPIQRSPPEP